MALPDVPTNIGPLLDEIKEAQKKYIDTHEDLPVTYDRFVNSIDFYQSWEITYFLKCAYLAALEMLNNK